MLRLNTTNLYTPIIFLAVLFGISNTIAQEKYLMFWDDLLSKTKYGAKVGGNFTGNGYQPTGNQHILYELPFTLKEGEIEFEVSGFTAGAVTERSAFLVMYDGTGVTEPAPYAYDFRNNYFRLNFEYLGTSQHLGTKLHVDKRGLTEPLGFIPDNSDFPDPAWEFGGKAGNFSTTYWDKFVIRWKDRKMTIWQNGQFAWGQDYSSPGIDYSPRIHRIWLGSGPGKFSQEGSPLFRNFKISSFSKFTNAHPLTIATTNLPGVTQNKEYLFALSAFGGELGYTWNITQGPLPLA